MTTAIVQRSVSFYGDELVAIQQGETTYTPVKPVCDILGIDWESQRQRIARDEVLSTCACMIQVQLPDDTQRRDHVCLPVDYLHGWLFGVDVARIRPELRERLILYKRECYRVLSQAFSGAGQVDAGRLAEIEQRLAALEAGQRLARRAAQKPISQEAAEVIAVLRQLGGQAQPRQIAALLPGISIKRIDMRLWRMVRQGLLRRPFYGVYQLPDSP